MATLALGGAIAASFVYVLARRKGPSRAAIAWLLGLAAAFSAPGAWEVLVDRPDAPLRAARTAESIQRLAGEIDSFASARGECLIDVRDDCVSCQPILRFVLPARSPCAPRQGRIDLEPDAIEKGCEVRRGVLECGGASL